ncbi:MAG: SOS response-associated peptidase [Herpetosiphon sp.]
MCGRYTLKSSPQAIADHFMLPEVPTLAPHFNIAPSVDVPVVLAAEHQERSLHFLRWGFIPAWADDAAIGNRMINARSETVASSPAFRNAFRSRRCLVIADGFYEWQKSGTVKQPFHYRMSDGLPFAFAGLWEEWKRGDGPSIVSCTIVTTEANEVVRPVHNRMPVILPPEHYDRWLGHEKIDVAGLSALLQPYASESMTGYPVTPLVNNPRNDAPECVQPLA